jgi:hypothetical protein
VSSNVFFHRPRFRQRHGKRSKSMSRRRSAAFMGIASAGRKRFAIGFVTSTGEKDVSSIRRNYRVQARARLRAFVGFYTQCKSNVRFGSKADICSAKKACPPYARKRHRLRICCWCVGPVRAVTRSRRASRISRVMHSIWRIAGRPPRIFCYAIIAAGPRTPGEQIVKHCKIAKPCTRNIKCLAAMGCNVRLWPKADMS